MIAATNTNPADEPETTPNHPATLISADDLRNWIDSNRDTGHGVADGDSLLNDLAATFLTPPTMADVVWKNGVHDGLCAEKKGGGVVRMIGLYRYAGQFKYIMCYLGRGGFEHIPEADLTPIPGTRVDLTPQWEPQTNSDANSDEGSATPATNNDDLPRSEDVLPGEVWEVVCLESRERLIGVRSAPDNPYRKGFLFSANTGRRAWTGVDGVTLIRRLVPETTPAPSTTLTRILGGEA